MAFTQRGLLSLQRFSSPSLLRRAAGHNATTNLPATVAAFQQVRSQTTLEIKTPEQGQQELARQRLQRPISPHIAIYRPQVHYLSSGLERLTGMLFAGGIYLYGTAYLAAPLLGWDLSSASLVAAFGGLPLAVKMAAKFCVAWPFTFHCLNGVRYLATSTGKTLSDKRVVVKIAWGVIGLSLLSAVGLVALV